MFDIKEVKFRVWYEKTKQMSSNTQTIFDIYKNDAGGNSEHVKFLQYIGINDRKNREIYEGDIVAIYQDDLDKLPVDSEGFPDIEAWGDKPIPTKEISRDIVDISKFRFWLKNERFGFEGELLISPTDCEVIGNIYQHSNLID